MASRTKASHLRGSNDDDLDLPSSKGPPGPARRTSLSPSGRRGSKAKAGAAAPRSKDHRLKRHLLVGLGLVLLVLNTSGAVFTYLVPHTQVQLTTVYHGAWSAKFVQSEVTNKGTHPLEGLTVRVAVWNGTHLLNQTREDPGSLAPHSSYTLGSLTYWGESRETYSLIVEVSFNSAGTPYQQTYRYEIAQYQNLVWKDEIFQMG